MIAETGSFQMIFLGFFCFDNSKRFLKCIILIEIIILQQNCKHFRNQIPKHINCKK